MLEGVAVGPSRRSIATSVGQWQWICNRHFRSVFGFVPKGDEVFEIAFTPKIKKVK